MVNCQPQEGIFPRRGNTLTFDQDDMHIEICCRPDANHQCTVTFKFTAPGDVVIPSRESILVEQQYTKLGLAQAWEPFHNQLVGWLSTQTTEIQDKGYSFMVRTRSGLLRRGIELLL